MAQDIVVNGTTYPAVEAIATMDENGNPVMFYPDAVRMMNLTEEEYSALSISDKVALYESGIRMLNIIESVANLVPSAIAKSGAVYNGCGYMNGYRLNSSGAVQESNESVLTGYIPYTHGKTIEITGGLNPANAGGQYIATYDNSFNLLYVNYLSSLISNSGGVSKCTEDNIYTYTVNTSKFASSANTNGFVNAAFIRVSLSPCIGRQMKVKYI